MKFSIVACINQNLVLGDGDNLIYHIKSDLKNFRRITDGSIVVCGRKTYESFPKRPLPNRVNIVLTRDENYKAEGAIIVHSILELIELGRDFPTDAEVFVIGGGQIYKEFLDKGLVDTMYLTMVHDKRNGNVLFPINPLENKDWKIFYQSCPQVDGGFIYDFTIFKKPKLINFGN